jgi:hypothetical protein
LKGKVTTKAFQYLSKYVIMSPAIGLKIQLRFAMVSSEVSAYKK